jgi:hypothetical protein
LLKHPQLHHHIQPNLRSSNKLLERQQ